jgi:hypothetical protein
VERRTVAGFPQHQASSPVTMTWVVFDDLTARDYLRDLVALDSPGDSLLSAVDCVPIISSGDGSRNLDHLLGKVS